MGTTSTSLATTSAFNYLIAPTGDEESNVAELIKNNLGGDKINPFDLDTVKIPSGGGLAFAVPDIEAEDGESSSKTITGVIVHRTYPRKFYKESVENSDGHQAPDCKSDDGVSGYGDPGGSCSGCPMNAWGSARKGSGKACAEQIQVFLVKADELLPTVIIAPPTSLKSIRQYATQLTSKGIALAAVETEFSLRRVAGPPVYSVLSLKMTGRVPASAQKQVKDYSAAMKSLFAK